MAQGTAGLDTAEARQEKLQLARDRLASLRSATGALERALASNPDEARLLTSLGYNYINVQEYERAAAAFEKALASDPSLYRASVGLGECYKQLGDLAKAAQVFEALFREGNHSLLVCWNLGQLPKSLVNVDLLSALDQLDTATVADKDTFRSRHAFCKASALDKAGQHSEAWAELVTANDLKAKLLDRDYPERSDWRTGDGHGRGTRLTGRKSEEGVPQSLFILGPSRSGKTTMEALVGTALSGAKRGFENVIITDVRQAFKTAGLFAGGRLDAMAPEVRAMFRQVYLQELAQRTTGAIFTNTAPGLILDALAIAEIVPNARFIFVKRDIDDIAIRIYMKDYERDRHAYSYSIDGIYAHVRWYFDLIDRLVEMLPDVARTVAYEDIVEDAKAAINIAAELCGVPVPAEKLSQPGDDRGCGVPYKAYMRAARAIS